jgi:23S rRNA (adenine2503-C2)-methyltransferase
MKQNLYDLKLSDVRSLVEELGEPKFRAEQIWQGLYQSRWSDLEEFTTLPLDLRMELDRRYALGGLRQEKTLSSSDGHTRKYLYRLQDQSAIETVLMGYDQRETVCISSQVGCAMGCSFCATGNMGFFRNLTRGEIIEQVVKSAAIVNAEGKELTNVVFMGMGEPFHNYENVLSAVGVLNDPEGFGMGMRRFTISTVGIVPGILKFAAEGSQINLAISLHAADDQLRSSILPVNKKYPISSLMDACNTYLQQTNRRVTIEWALIEGVNDSRDQAGKLVQLLMGKLFHVNLIQLNPFDHFPGQPSPDQAAADFQGTLQQAGIPCTIRLRRGIDIQAGCGQLASEAN